MTLSRTLLTWLTLVAATMMSLLLGHRSGVSAMTNVGILVVAWAKARLVALDFMEVRGAPAILRWGAECFLGLLACALIALFGLSH